jgi:hypothetical protein
VGQAFLLDGIDDFVDVGNAANLHVSGGDFTVDAWVNFNALSHPPGTNNGPAGDMSIVDKIANSGGVNSDGWRLIKQDDNRFWFCFGQLSGIPTNGCVPGGPLTVQSTTLAITGRWYHVTGVKRGSQLEIYVNGVLEQAKALGALVNNTEAANLRIGGNVQEGAFLNGLVDEVEIYNRALTSGEIQAIFNAGAAGKCKGP